LVFFFNPHSAIGIPQFAGGPIGRRAGQRLKSNRSEANWAKIEDGQGFAGVGDGRGGLRTAPVLHVVLGRDG